ncbi:MAG TPA: amino acid adenylation domain-containing protein, partial [Thermoanaerobaculia bacterium]|nr:amino acid adenylation domain-containing protein [Thermoanaerobaculia bacterium]
TTEAPDATLVEVPSLRYTFRVGDVLTRRDVERRRRMAPAVTCVNYYGSTETQRAVGYHVAGEEEPREVLPLGRGIPDVQLLVLNPGGGTGGLAGIGELGEVSVRSPHIALGYLGDPQLTAQRFVADLYRTGDLGRYLPNGEAVFAGRADTQVKIRGFRIELGEIESVLGGFPGVREAVVIARQDRGEERYLAAYVVPAATATLATLEVQELRAFLRERLQDSMVPATFTLLDELPLTPNRKVDRKALPAPEWQDAGKAHVAPRTPVEEALAGIWAELLGLERVGATDHFFELGGHSLLAIRVTSRLREAFGVEIPLRDLFVAPRLSDLAVKIEAARQTGTQQQAPPLVPLAPALREGPLPLSFAQQRLWFIDQLEPGSPLYNVPAALRVEGPLDGAVLARCLGEIVRRHEALRTAFAAPQGVPVQVIRPAEPFLLPVVDLSALPESAREDLVRPLTAAETRRPFDLASGPLLRGLLLRLAAQDHAVVLTMHHIASDGWSIGILVREIAALYAAFAADRPSPLPELPVQYADFAAWQSSWLRGEVLDQEIAFWRRELAGLPPLLELPTDHPRPAVLSHRGAARPVRLSAGLTQQMKALAGTEGATLFMVLLAGFQALLARISGQDDLAVGSPVAGRNRVETEGLIGFFVNTLVLRGDVAGAPTFRELLGRVRETALAAYLHQDVPFERLVEELAPARSLAHSPLFQVMLVLQNAPFESLEIENLRLRPVVVKATTAKFDLTIHLAEHDGGLSGTFEHATDLFATVTIDRLIAHYERLLTTALAAPELSTPELPLLSPAERHQAIAEWNDTGVAPAREVLLLDLLAARAEQDPHGELAARSDRLATHLRALGIGPDVIVALFLERSVDLVVALLAVLKAGGAYLPLETSLPCPRLSFLLEDSRAPLLLTRTRLLPALPEHSCRVVCLDDLPESGREAGLAVQPTADNPTADNLAYVLYTSGSTGNPKGVAVTHRGLANYLLWAADVYPAGEGRGAPVHSPVSFDLTVTSLFLPLLAGRCVELVPEEEGVEGLAAALAEGGFGLVKLTPSHLDVLQRLLPPERVSGCAGAFVIGGEPLSGEQLAFWRLHAPGLRLINEYGPTETVVGCCTYEVPDSLPPAGPVPIGRPIANTRILILDERLCPVPIGVSGELYLGGAGVCRGYLHRSGLTAEKLVPDPFGTWGERLYRTGDLARRLPDGTIEFLGRSDHQVKVRGFRIELGEIEAALSALSGVIQAVVIVREDTPGVRHLVAYVVGELEPRSFREQLRERLPEYMVPDLFVALDSLPLTANGKVDRKVLPAPDQQPFSESYQAPRTPVEEVLAAIWGEVLGLERVGTADRFFDLGGHSLLATQVLSRVRQAFGVELPLRDLFEAPALSDLAARVEKALRTGTGSAAPPLVPISREGELPLSFAQQRLWFLDQLDPDNSIYNIQVALRIEGPLDGAVLALCLGEIVRRHEVLRTVYAAPEGSPVQVIQPAAPFPLQVVDLSEREALALAVAEEEGARPFDLARGPVLRGVLLRSAAEDHVVVLTLHHIAGDAWSLGILVHELTTLYAAFAEGRPSPLPELPVQYADFAVWQSSWLRDEILDEKISFWRSELAGLPPLLELPTDRPRPAAQSYRGASRPLRLPAELTAQIQDLAAREGATLFMVLLAGFQALLARYSGQRDLAVGSPVAGRNRIETEGLIGFFVNTLVLRGNLSGNPSFLELLGRSRETALAAYLHQDVPFEKLVQELAPERKLSHSPLFQVVLTLQNTPVRSLETGTLRVQPVSRTSNTAKFDLELILQEHEGGLAGVAEYATDLFDAVTIDRLVVHYEKLLAAALAAPEQLASELPLLAPSERWQTLHEWNDTARACPKDLCIQDLFAEQAARTPHAVAVSFENQRLTYRELDERANRLAQWLIDRGIGNVRIDVLVALLVERSLEMIVALVGILKAGGSYAPLEPGMPPSRLRWLLDDVRSPVLLTQTALLPEIEEAGGFEGPVLLLDESLEGPELGAQVPSHPLQLAYVNYTSGSTGKPKGVVVPHLGVTRLVMNPDYMELGPDDVILQLSTYAWDAATWEIWGALLNGGRLVMIPRERVLDFRRLARVLVEERITALYLTTALFNQFVEQEGESLSGLSTLIIGGETASVPHFQKAVEMLHRTRIINEYGPTENTSYSSWQLVRSTPEQGALPIGKPLSNSTVYVLDRELQPMPLRLPGELFLGGDGLARGYLGRPDLTAERFVPHPFAAGERLYRTGDLGAWRPDGTLDFLGRMDFQVKIRGHRIEPAEVEDAIKRHEGVEDALVMAYEPVPQDRRLVAYVVGNVGNIVVDRLRHSLRERLPDYMVPASFVILPALPLTSIGKVDRKALPPPEQQSSEENHVAPATYAERTLAGIWAELLGLERVGVTDDFFTLGGHSLLAVRLMALIEQTFGVKLPLSMLFEAPTVRHLAGAVEGDPVWRSALVRLHPGGSGRPLFLVHPAGGDVFPYVELARKLGTERPVYGLQAVSESDGHPPTMEGLAAQYLASVREVQPEGPWLLAGWSSGAVTAYEMARQTESPGGAPSLLTLFDPPPPPEGRGVDATSLLLGFAALGGGHSEQKLETVRAMLEGLDVEAGLDLLVELARAEGGLPPGVGKPWMRERFDLYSRTMTALAGYVPRPYGGQVLLFRASASLAPGATDLTGGWGLLARTEAHLIPDANHFSLLQIPA